MTYKSAEEAVSELAAGFKSLVNDRQIPRRQLIDAIKAALLEDDFFNSYYNPSELMVNIIHEYEVWCETCLEKPDEKGKRGGMKLKDKNAHNCKDAGDLMEEIAFAAFSCLDGVAIDEIDSYRGPDAEHDIVVSGNNLLWDLLNDYFRLPSSTTILVEAKNENKSVNVSQFSRLAQIIKQNYENDCSLGIFFTRKGATGLPKKGQGRTICVRDTWLTQLLFHAQTKKAIIVFDDEDIRSLVEPGALVKLIYSKIREIELRTGFSVPLKAEDFQLRPLPPHLDKLRHKIQQ